MTTVNATMPALVEAALRAAIRAPSVHNTRPWRFVTGPSRIEVHLDRDRVLVVADRDAREARISCGAALFNLWLALRAAGRGAVIDLLPDSGRPDFLATVRIAGEQVAGPELLAMAAMIDRGVTNRRAVPASDRWALVRAAESEGGQLVLLDEPCGLGALAVPLRRYHIAEVTAERSFEQDPLVAVLATAGDTVLDQVRAGQALQRVLLTAAAVSTRGACCGWVTGSRWLTPGAAAT